MLMENEPGEVFDKAAIINVKINLTSGPIREKNVKHFEEWAAQIKNNIGIIKYNEIMESVEYQKLYEANLDIFKKIEVTQNGGEVSAKDMDFYNYQRYLRKSELQKKFFGTEVKEVKIGYTV